MTHEACMLGGDDWGEGWGRGQRHNAQETKMMAMYRP